MNVTALFWSPLYIVALLALVVFIACSVYDMKSTDGVINRYVYGALAIILSVSGGTGLCVYYWILDVAPTWIAYFIIAGLACAAGIISLFRYWMHKV